MQVNLHPYDFIYFFNGELYYRAHSRRAARPPDHETPWPSGPSLGERDWVCAGWLALFATWGSGRGEGRPPRELHIWILLGVKASPAWGLRSY